PELYVDDQLTRPIGARGQLQVQAGLRLAALQPDGHPFSGPRDVAVQPRVNVEYAPVPRLRLRAGWGRTAKQPTLEQLFPAPQYFDIVNVNYFATDPAERLAVLTTFIRDPTNPDLGYARGTKREAGVELAMGGGGYVSVVGFSDVIDDAVGVLSSPDFILRERFDLEPAGPGQPPRLIEPAAAVDTVPVLIHRPANVLRSETEGVELTAALPEITGVNTRLEVQGVWLRSRLEKEGLDFGPSTAFTTFQLDPGIARVPFWDAPVQTGSRSLLTYRLVHQQPAAGLVVSVTVQQYLEE